MDYSGLPAGLREGMQRYLEDGIKPGSFLTAVLENNLMNAFGQADQTNRYLLFEICSWFYNEAPAECWGSKEKVERWLRKWQS